MPLIAVASCRKIEDYRQAVLHAGGDVRIVDASMGIADALDGVDGVLLTGGEDVDPARYGEPRHATVTDVSAERDDFEIALVQETRRRQMPMLALCRGVQVLNVACGGSLVQDIPSEVTGALQHRLTVPPHQAFERAHEVWVDSDSKLATIMEECLNGTDTCEVNSRHHQAVKTVAPGFRISATAPDGVVEAIEDPEARFCIGVQWHPENFWRTGEFRPLFEGFIEAASSRNR